MAERMKTMRLNYFQTGKIEYILKFANNCKKPLINNNRAAAPYGMGL